MRFAKVITMSFGFFWRMCEIPRGAEVVEAGLASDGATTRVNNLDADSIPQRSTTTERQSHALIKGQAEER